MNKKLPKGDPGFVDISGSVELSSLRIQKIGEYRLGLEDVSGVLEPMTATGGGGKTEEPLDFYQKFENPVIRDLIVEEFWDALARHVASKYNDTSYKSVAINQFMVEYQNCLKDRIEMSKYVHDFYNRFKSRQELNVNVFNEK